MSTKASGVRTGERSGSSSSPKGLGTFLLDVVRTEKRQENRVTRGDDGIAYLLSADGIYL